MEIKKLAICSATQKEYFHDTLLYQSVTNLGIDVDLMFVTENKEPLAKVYNTFLEDLKFEDCDAAIFIHDDVILEHDPTPNLALHFDEYDIIGVAGCSRAEIKEPALWHLMGGGFNSPNLHGFAAHIHDGLKRITSFGSYPHRASYIDGVFIALNRKAIETARFDDECPSGFHFYDLNFCDGCRNKGLKIGVTGITITHNSQGLSELTEDWKSGQEYFIKKHNVES